MEPAWHARPTCPGLWLVLPALRAPFKQPVAMHLDQAEIDRGVPFHARCVYGPIPEPETCDE